MAPTSIGSRKDNVIRRYKYLNVFGNGRKTQNSAYALLPAAFRGGMGAAG